jgi:hypothetical protein
MQVVPRNSPADRQGYTQTPQHAGNFEMAAEEQRACIGCQVTEETVHLDRCPVCQKGFCLDCAYRATGRRFCSGECARAYFYGDSDDLEDDFGPDELSND